MYDVVIIGSGPAGYETAVKLKALGKSVCLIEKGELGGTCLNSGCIPTKTLVSAAKKFKDLGTLKRYGISLENSKFDYPTFKKFQNSVVSRLKKGLENGMKDIDFIQGEAVVLDDMILVNDQKIIYKNLVIATGSRPLVPAAWKDKVVDAQAFWGLENLPENIAIIGGGVIGCEYASMLADLGHNVSLFEKLPVLLATEEPEISQAILDELKARGVVIVLGEAVDINFLNAELIICAMGRVRNLEGFEKIIGNKNVFLAGDVADGVQLAHKASFDAEQISNIFEGKSVELPNIPSVIFTSPEISHAGLTKKEAGNVKQVRVNFAEIGKAVAENATKGFVLMNVQDFRIVGISIFGSYAAEMNASAQLIVTNQMMIDDLKKITFSHPTISEIFKIAAERFTNLFPSDAKID